MEVFLQKMVAGIYEFDSIDFFYMLFLFIIAVSVFFIALISAKFFYVWHKGIKNRKKSQLASEIMERLINLQDIITKIRDPFVFPSEKREVIEFIKSNSHLVLYENKVCELVPLFRIKKYRREIDSFFVLKAQAQLFWKDGAFELFQKLSGIIDKTEYSSKFLYEYNIEEAERNKYKSNIWYNRDNDVVSTEVQGIVDEFKKNLVKLYKSNRLSWKKLKKNKK